MCVSMEVQTYKCTWALTAHTYMYSRVLVLLSMLSDVSIMHSIMISTFLHLSLCDHMHVDM